MLRGMLERIVELSDPFFDRPLYPLSVLALGSVIELVCAAYIDNIYVDYFAYMVVLVAIIGGISYLTFMHYDER